MEMEPVETVRGRSRRMKLARMAVFDREAYIPSRKLRRMSDVSQVWVITCSLARADAGLDKEGALDAHSPERRGTYLGSGFGCTQTTWEYLLGMLRDGAGMANPFLFSESVANAPAGYSAIEMDTRAASITFTCGDASAAAAVAFAARAIRTGRLDLAYCGGVEMFSPPCFARWRRWARPRSSARSVCSPPRVDGCGASRGARVYAELAADASASDPCGRRHRLDPRPGPFAGAMRRAARMAGGEPRDLFLHACGLTAADDAERRAAKEVFPRAPIHEISSITGSLSAAGGLNSQPPL